MSGPHRHGPREEDQVEAKVLACGLDFALSDLPEVLKDSIEAALVAELIQVVGYVPDSTERALAGSGELLDFGRSEDDILLVLHLQIVLHVLCRHIEVLRRVAPEGLDVRCSELDVHVVLRRYPSCHSDSIFGLESIFVGISKRDI